MSQQQQQFTPRKKTIFTDYRFPHPATEAPLEGGKYPAQLMFDQKNNGEIVLKINDGVYKPGVPSTHKEVELDGYTRNALFAAVLEATNDPNFNVRQMSVRKKQFVRGPGGSRMSENPIVQANFTIARNADGVVSLGYSKGDYKAMFNFKGPNHTVILVKTEAGTVEDYGVMSRFSARAWVNFHQEALNRMEIEGWQPPKPKENNGYNNNNNSGSQPPKVNDLDLDFDSDY